jgi:hypothetical protein
LEAIGPLEGTKALIASPWSMNFSTTRPTL